MNRKKREKGWLKGVLEQAKKDVESWPDWMKPERVKVKERARLKKELDVLNDRKDGTKLLFARLHLMRRISNFKDVSRGWVWKRKEKIESLEYALSILDAESERRRKK